MDRTGPACPACCCMRRGSSLLIRSSTVRVPHVVRHNPANIRHYQATNSSSQACSRLPGTRALLSRVCPRYENIRPGSLLWLPCPPRSPRFLALEVVSSGRNFQPPTSGRHAPSYAVHNLLMPPILSRARSPPLLPPSPPKRRPRSNSFLRDNYVLSTQSPGIDFILSVDHHPALSSHHKTSTLFRDTPGTATAISSRFWKRKHGIVTLAPIL